MENELRDRAERMARKLRACADDEQCAACAEECGVNDGTLLLAAAQNIRDLLEGAGGEERVRMRESARAGGEVPQRREGSGRVSPGNGSRATFESKCHEYR